MGQTAPLSVILALQERVEGRLALLVERGFGLGRDVQWWHEQSCDQAVASLFDRVVHWHPWHFEVF